MLPKIQFKQDPPVLWEGVVVLKELILTVSTLRGCGGLETTDF